MSFKGLVTGYEVYAPGTRLKFSEKDDYIRLFLSWKYKSDIDLSIGFVSESPEKEGYMDFNEKSMSVNYVSYRKLSLKYAAHSGDYTNGSDGAVEYIDINRKDVIKDYRFGIVVVNVFRGGSFENQNAIAGIQISSKDSFQKTATSSKQLGPVGCKFFDPTKTKLKLDLFGNYNYNVPMIIDFKKGEIIVCNLGNSLPEASYLSKESASTLAKYISPIFSYNKTKPNLYDLIMLHAVANGCEVDTEYNPETQYDYIFSNEIEQAVKAYDIEFFVENLMS